MGVRRIALPLYGRRPVPLTQRAVPQPRADSAGFKGRRAYQRGQSQRMLHAQPTNPAPGDRSTFAVGRPTF